MKQTLLCSAALFLASITPGAHAATFPISFSGAGVSGTVNLTYGTATDATYPQAFEINGISGSFTDTNIGIANANITGLIPISPAKPEPGNFDTPSDFSRFAAAGLPVQNNGFITYDNLLYPGGSPQTATSYPYHGGVLDIYGLLFTLNNGDVVDFWSSGILPGTDSPEYGIAVANSAGSLDYVGGVTAATPEPGTFLLLGTGLLAILFWHRPAFLGTHS